MKDKSYLFHSNFYNWVEIFAPCQKHCFDHCSPFAIVERKASESSKSIARKTDGNMFDRCFVLVTEIVDLRQSQRRSSGYHLPLPTLVLGSAIGRDFEPAVADNEMNSGEVIHDVVQWIGADCSHAALGPALGRWTSKAEQLMMMNSNHDMSQRWRFADK